MTQPTTSQTKHPGPAIQDPNAVGQRFDRWKDEFEKRKAALKPETDPAKPER